MLIKRALSKALNRWVKVQDMKCTVKFSRKLFLYSKSMRYTLMVSGYFDLEQGFSNFLLHALL